MKNKRLITEIISSVPIIEEKFENHLINEQKLETKENEQETNILHNLKNIKLSDDEKNDPIIKNSIKNFETFNLESWKETITTVFSLLFNILNFSNIVENENKTVLHTLLRKLFESTHSISLNETDEQIIVSSKELCNTILNIFISKKKTLLDSNNSINSFNNNNSIHNQTASNLSNILLKLETEYFASEDASLRAYGLHEIMQLFQDKQFTSVVSFCLFLFLFF
jgi:hypothetical protein